MDKIVTTPQSQRGFTLVELSIATVVMGVMATVGVWYATQQLAYSRADAQADSLTVIGSALGSYETKYFPNIVGGQPVPGVVNPKSPTVSELLSLGLLDKSISSINLYSGGYSTVLVTIPSGCTGSACNIQGLVYTTTPLTDASGRESDALAGEATTHGGGNLGYSSIGNASNIVGPGGNWTMPNPLGNVPGILAMRVGLSNTGLDQYLRRDGTLPMTGDLNMGSQSVTNVTNVSAAGTIQGASAVIQGSVFTGTITTGPASLGDTSVNGNATISGSVTASNGTFAGRIDATGRIHTQEYLQVDGYGKPGAPCSQNGLIAQDGTGASVSCQSGIWRSSSSQSIVGYGGSFTYYNNWGVCAVANEATGSCSCPSGYTAHGVASWTEGSGLAIWICQKYPA